MSYANSAAEMRQVSNRSRAQLLDAVAPLGR